MPGRTVTRKSNKLSPSEIEELFPPDAKRLGGPKDLAQLLGVGVATVYEWIAKGRLDTASRKRGKRRLIHLRKAIEVLFNGPTWETKS